MADIVREFRAKYASETDTRVKILDVGIVYVTLTLLVEFAYVLLVGTFPFNAFLSGFFSALTSLVLLLGVRTQVVHRKEFTWASSERSIAELLFCAVILHVGVMNFLG